MSEEIQLNSSFYIPTDAYKNNNIYRTLKQW